MARECAFTLPTGRKCRAIATTSHAFCRHHGAPVRPPAPRIQEFWNRRSCWRDMGRSLHDMPASEVPGSILALLQGLLEGVVSDRFAARCLRVLLQRCGCLPVILAPKFAPEALFAPMPPARSAVPATSGAAPSREKLVQDCFALLGSLPSARPSAVHAQPPAVHSRPSAPAPAAAR